jgi:hypothetical protein
MHPDHPVLPEVQLFSGATFQGRPCHLPGQAMPSIISESLQQPRRPKKPVATTIMPVPNDMRQKNPSRMTWKWPSCLPRAQSPLPSLSLSAHITIRNSSPNQEKGATKPFEWCFSPQNSRFAPRCLHAICHPHLGHYKTHQHHQLLRARVS